MKPYITHLGTFAAIVVLVSLAIWKVPQWQVGSAKLTPKERIELENAARATLAQILGGLAVFGTLYFTWRSIKATEENLNLTQINATKTLRISQEGQITERFTQAIEHLGSSSLQTRLGGIYSLERIARDSKRDYWPIMEILTAYVREKSPWPPMEEREKALTDVQAALTVLGRRAYAYGEGEEHRLDLSRTDLRGISFTISRPDPHLDGWTDIKGFNLNGINLEGANLQGVDFMNVQLKQANLMRTRLQGANLAAADLRRAMLNWAELQQASLFQANLHGAKLGGANLEEVCLADANLQQVNLFEANLRGANLTCADLRQANLRGVVGLTQEQVSQAFINEHTSLPHYLMPQKPEEK